MRALVWLLQHNSRTQMPRQRRRQLQVSCQWQAARVLVLVLVLQTHVCLQAGCHLSGWRPHLLTPQQQQLRCRHQQHTQGRTRQPPQQRLQRQQAALRPWQLLQRLQAPHLRVWTRESPRRLSSVPQS